jgi:hypothetical protein
LFEIGFSVRQPGDVVEQSRIGHRLIVGQASGLSCFSDTQ